VIAVDLGEMILDLGEKLVVVKSPAK